MRRRALAAALRDLAPWLALAAVWAAFLWSRHGGLYAASDDSYIYLGYVKRALTEPRELFSYNPGEHSAGITGPLYYYLLVLVCGAVRALAPSSRIEADLLLGMSLTNVALLLLGAQLYLRCWRSLVGGGERIGALALASAFALFCAQPKWLWGVFAGMESPLAACLALLLLERLLRRAPAWHVSLAAALLVATRPETMLVAWAAPALAVYGDPRRPALPRLAAAWALGLACLSALILPCWLLTGRVFPSSMGTRVELVGFLAPDALARYFRGLLGYRDYWLSEWWVGAGALLVAGLAVGLRQGRWTVARLFGFVLAFLVLRVVAGIAAFNIEDRYVSYLWPLYALGLAALAPVRLRPSRALAALAALVVYAGTAAAPVRDFLVRVDRHVGAMQRIVVEPSLWMRAQLPAGARICMEPAGALRVFTDFYLVDAIGLTTTHADTDAGNYLDFLHDERVGFVFDRPERVGELLLATGAARDRRAWAPRLAPWGNLHLYEVDMPAAIEIVSLESRAVGGGRPLAAFDNNREPGWDRLLGGGVGAPLADVAAGFEEPALVDEVRLALSSAWRGGPGAYRIELRRDGAWLPLAPASVRRESAGPDRLLVSLVLDRAAPADAVRIVREGAGAGGSPVVDELTLLRDGRPYVWLWDDALRP